jgi:DNA-binding transcriptional regulator LsrR (DeoR family)
MALNQRMQKAVEMLVHTKMQKQEIAAELKVSRTTFSKWVAREDFQEALNAEMHRAFQPLAYKARQRLNDLIDSKNEQVALAASKDALDRAGYGATQKVENTITNKDITIEITED